MKRFVSAVFILLGCFFFAGIVGAETKEEERRIEEEKRRTLTPTERAVLEEQKRWVVDYGGWVNFRYDDYKDDDNDASTSDGLSESLTTDLRFWTKLTLKPPPDAGYQNVHSLYLRVKDAHVVDRGADTAKHHDYNEEGPHLDYGYLVLDLRPVWLELGRRYFSVGQGIAYSNVHDGVETMAVLGEWNIKSFASTTLPSEQNIDVSVPGFDEVDHRNFFPSFDENHHRNFYGMEITYLGVRNHGLYLFGVFQDDRTTENPDDRLQDYRYDSVYLGLGSQGKLRTNLHYWAEIIQELGTSYTSFTNNREKIIALASDIGLSYDLNMYSHPNLTLEYAFGSGDKDRINVTDTIDGNTEGYDRNFLYFGYLPAGYALGARLSNIHFLKAGTLVKPFEKFRSLRNLSTGMEVYRFYKHRREGGISDFEASRAERDIGWELDFRISWEVFSDLRTTVEYGIFYPGDAYPSVTDAHENYLAMDVTVTF